MEEIKFKNKYRIKSARHAVWDYGENGYYFITICTEDRECYFGDITNGVIKLFNIGKFADQCWREIPKHFPFVELDQYIVMPNHIHGILIINNNDTIVETRNCASLRERRKFGPLQKNSISSIVNSYKGVIKTFCIKDNIDFSWQPRYYDHIIRDEKSLIKIREYIHNNPLQWEIDRNNIENLYM